MNEDNFIFDLRDEAPVEQAAPVEEGATTDAPVNTDGAEAVDSQAQNMQELLDRIAELEAAQSAPAGNPALSILQDKDTLRELVKDYENMPVIDLLKEDFMEKNHKVLAANPNLDVDMAFRKYLQKNYNEEFEPLIDENFGLDEYDYALLKSQVDELRGSKIQKQEGIRASFATAPSNIETDSSVGNNGDTESGDDGFQTAMREYEQKLNSYVETGLKQMKPSALPEIPEGFSMPVIGEDTLRNMINTLSAEQLPLLVADDNNVYPNLSLLKEIAEYRELSKNLPAFLAAYKEKVVAEAFENVKRGIDNKAIPNQAPANPYSNDVVSPFNMGDNAIVGFKF